MVAGLEDISEGVLKIGERVVNNVPPKDRDIAMVFQSYALYLHLSVYDNIAFSLKLQGEKKPEIARRVNEAAHVLGLETLLDRKPRALSGGQRQRVAMGRAIVRDPQAFLMDEPLSNLDAKLRVQMRAEISRLQTDLGTTTIYVTHDQVEAMTMGDRIAVMRKGELQQVGPPQDLYDRPVNLFVGGFIGSPAMNMLEGSSPAATAAWPSTSAGSSSRSATRRSARGPRCGTTRETVIVGIRPEHVEDATLAEAPPDRRLRGEVVLTEALGSEIVAHVAVEAKPALTEDVRELAQDIGEDIDEEVAEGKTTLVGRVGARLNWASATRLSSRSTLGLCTSSTRTREPGSTTRKRRKEPADEAASPSSHRARAHARTLRVRSGMRWRRRRRRGGGETRVPPTRAAVEAETSPAGSRS